MKKKHIEQIDFWREKFFEKDADLERLIERIEDVLPACAGNVMEILNEYRQVR